MNAPKTTKKRVSYPPAFIARARSLYLIKGKGPSEISDLLKVPPDTVKNWIGRGKWPEERKARLIRLEVASVSRANDENSAFLDSVATQSEEITEDALEMARNHAQSGSEFAARNLQSATQAVKNMVDVYFKTKGLDARTTGGASIQIGSVFVNSIPVPRPEKQAVDLASVQLPQAKP